MNRLAMAAALGLLLAGLALSSSFLVGPLRPWPDQGMMLQAARRHAAGQGLTVTAAAVDLTAPTFGRLTYFPPLYPLLVSGLLQIGVPLELAVKCVNVAALALGTLGWCWLAWAGLSNLSLRALFGLLLVTSCGAAIPKGGTTDLLLWAGMPGWLGLLLRAARVSAPRAAVGWTLAASAFAGVLIAVRWAGVFLVPAGGLFLLSCAAGHWRDRGLRAVLYCLPAASTYELIVVLNAQLSGTQGSYLAFLQPHWDFHLLTTCYPLEALVTVPLGLEALLKRCWRALDPQLALPLLGLVWRVALPATLIGLALWLGRSREGERRPWPAQVYLIGLSALTLVAFLGWMTLRYNWAQTSWAYLEEARYYRPIWPACALFWLLLLERGSARIRRAALLLGACGLYVLQAQVRWERTRLVQRDESWELVSEVLRRTRAPGLHVVLDNDVSDYLIRVGPQVVPLTYPAAEDVVRLKVGQPARLWLARRVAEPAVYVLDPHFDAKRFEAITQRFPASRVWSSNSGGYELYVANLEP